MLSREFPPLPLCFTDISIANSFCPSLSLVSFEIYKTLFCVSLYFACALFSQLSFYSAVEVNLVKWDWLSWYCCCAFCSWFVLSQTQQWQERVFLRVICLMMQRRTQTRYQVTATSARPFNLAAACPALTTTQPQMIKELFLQVQIHCTTGRIIGFAPQYTIDITSSMMYYMFFQMPMWF